MKLWGMTVVLTALLAASADDQPGGLAEKVRKAAFVFKGTVSQTGASNVKAVENAETTVVVRIDQVLKSPKILAGHAGQDVTVIFGPADGAAALRVGQKAIFFTEGAVYGEKLAVREVAAPQMEGAASAPAAAAPKAVPKQAAAQDTAKQVVEMATEQADDNLKVHLASADAVVFGTVASVQPVDPQRLTLAATAAAAAAPGKAKKRRISEHDPNWHVAVVNVDSVEKGKPGQKQVHVVFAQSGDVMWRAAPKFKVNQTGTFILHKNQIRNENVRSALMAPVVANGPEVYSALDSNDWHPQALNQANLNRIRRLLGKD
jgi:hypothetical protein